MVIFQVGNNAFVKVPIIAWLTYNTAHSYELQTL